MDRSGAEDGRASYLRVRHHQENRADYLPVELSSLVGRGREVAEINRLLAEGNNRLISLTGPGGAGKTRLAAAAASEAAKAFQDGVRWVGLASLSDPDLVAQAVARAVEVREQPGLSLIDTLAEALRDKRLLLVLDNCEHLIEACARFVHTMLASCIHLHVLATSREALGVAGEATWRIPPLAVPEADHPLSVGEAEGYEAIALFVERARARLSTFSLTPQNAGVVAEICRELDGMPLAIELAAVRVPMLSVGQIAERLERPLELLSAGARTAEPRQRTLRGTLSWSHELLSEPERGLFRRLSAFAGGWTLAAAEVVGSGESIEQEEVLDLLSGLVDKSLVAAGSETRDGLRYRMLEPVRQYARELLDKGGEAERVRERHAQYYLALAREAEPNLSGTRQAEWLGRLEREHDNLRAALGWAIEGGNAELALRLTGALERFWWVGGHLSEGRHWLGRGLAANVALPASVRAKALNDAGWMALYQHDLDRAVTLLEESVALFEEVGDERSVATSLFNLGHAMLHKGDKERLATLCDEAEGLARGKFTDPWAAAELLVLLGMSALYEGNHGRAVALLEESMASFRNLGDTQRVTLCVTHLWMAELEGGDPERAAALVSENLRLLRGLGIKPRIYNDLLGGAILAAIGGRPARAARLWAAAEALREAIGLAIVLWDHVPTDYEARLAATRSQLGEEAFATAWEEGKAMTPERAIGYALSEASPPTDALPPKGDKEAGLSARELEVLRLVAQGLTDPQVAERLYLSPRTVNHHLRSVYAKLGVRSRAAAATEAVGRGLI